MLQSLDSRFLDHFCTPHSQVLGKIECLGPLLDLAMRCKAQYACSSCSRTPASLTPLAKFDPPSQVVFSVSNGPGEMAQIWYISTSETVFGVVRSNQPDNGPWFSWCLT